VSKKETKNAEGGIQNLKQAIDKMQKEGRDEKFENEITGN
jgi:hypothetical protein